MEDSFEDNSQFLGFPSSSHSQSNLTVDSHNAPATMSRNNGDGGGGNGHDGDYVPRPKRIACVVCRRRKLKCDGKKPSCGTCSRLGHSCAYDEVRKKSGPKRGYVKQLEARLAQVEMLLPNAAPAPQTRPPTQEPVPFESIISNEAQGAKTPEIPAFTTDDISASILAAESTGQPPSDPQNMPETGYSAWDMISLGLEEPLPAQSVINELNMIYFEKVHPSIPLIHRPRYMAASNLAPNLRPPVYLQYILWCHAAAISDKYYNLHGFFYQRARKYAELEETRGFGESVLSLAFCQTWLLISTYESKMLHFPRAWLSTGKCGRLAVMMGLNRLDGESLNVKQTLSPPKDWTEREERRRTFWLVFCCDRYASIGTSWPVLIDERDITTSLPATEEAFTRGIPEKTLKLSETLMGEDISNLSSLGGVVLLAALFGRNLSHLHRPEAQDNEYDLNGEFWKRHRSYDNILLNIALQLPNHLRLPGGMNDPNVIYTNMCIHTSTICLHQAAIFKAERNKMPAQMITESKRRCIVAADQVSNIMKLISYMDLTILNPFLSFCVYVSARVFVQYLKSRPDDTVVQSSLNFIIAALNALKNKNPLTETFLVQLEVDMEGISFKGSQGLTKRTNYDSRTQTRPCGATCPSFIGITNLEGASPPEANSISPWKSQISALQDSANATPTSDEIMQHLSKIAPGVITPGVEVLPSANGIETTPEFFSSDNNNSNSNSNRTPSDQPSPAAALNPLSGTSYAGPQQTFPSAATTTATTTQTQTPIEQLDIHPSASTTDPSNATDPSQISGQPSVSINRQIYQDNPETPFFTTNTENTFTMPSPSNWDFSTSQPFATSPDNMAQGTTAPLDEARLEQLVSANNWSAWRGG